MSQIWTPDPVNTPPKWMAMLAALLLIVVAAGSLILGFATGWSRGTPRQSGGGAAEDGKVLEAAPLDPTVTLRGVNTAEAPPVEATNTATNTAREEEPETVEEEAPQAPPPTVTAEPPKVEAPPPAQAPAQTPAPAAGATNGASPDVPF